MTKHVDVDTIKEAISQGVTDIGENRVQELEAKYLELGDSVNYHMIGHLQTNKVKYIIDKVSLIHSLDRLSLAKEIDKRAKAHGKIMDVLIQVNVSKEESKYGVFKEDLIPFIKKLEKYDNICIRGLMTMAPHYEDSEKTRYVFRELRELSQKIKDENLERVNMDILSMGMTNDYKVAVEEGASHVRVGTGIFGNRNY